jgi:hypothetical protein
VVIGLPVGKEVGVLDESVICTRSVRVRDEMYRPVPLVRQAV